MSAQQHQNHCNKDAQAQQRAREQGKSVPLKVLSSGKSSAPRSTMGKWRAGVLIAVHLAFVAHLIQWMRSDAKDGVRNTISPLEPSESMSTIELGQVNAGFIVFCVGILATLVLGRWFCGWLCHMVAVQDLCSWMMKKIGVHPKPWRSRLLVWAPLVLALYMFVWPTFRRLVLARLFGELTVLPDGREVYLIKGGLGEFFGEVIPWPAGGFESHFLVEDFWATFPSIYIAIPSILVCGFAIVYFLGSKGFCTYGCPYGGFFGPVDRLATARIRVTDDCHQCGHCTAVCTSNVRVSDEVRDYGMVVDPGCMKCLDCVSACPNDALYVGFGKPALFSSPRVSDEQMAKTKAKKAARYDLTLGEEVAMGVVMLVLTLAYRGLYFGSVPMLMAMGLSSIATFMVYKTWRLARDANVRGPFWQLKKGGRLTLVGAAFAAVTGLMILVSVQGAVINVNLRLGDGMYARTMGISPQAVLSPEYKPEPSDRELALEAIRHYRRAGPMNEGGFNFQSSPRVMARLGWLHAVAGDLESAERFVRRALSKSANDDLVSRLVEIMLARQTDNAKIEQAVEAIVVEHPELEASRAILANGYAKTNRPSMALELYRRALLQRPRDPMIVFAAVRINLQLDRARTALEIAAAAVRELPESYLVLMAYASALAENQDGRKALGVLQRTNELFPDVAEPVRWQAEILDVLGDAEQASVQRKLADEIDARLAAKQRRTPAPQSPPPQAPPPPVQVPNR